MISPVSSATVQQVAQQAQPPAPKPSVQTPQIQDRYTPSSAGDVDHDGDSK